MEFGFHIENGVPVWTEPADRDKYFSRLKDGTWGKEALAVWQPAKTPEQLGYYYAVLLPQLHRARIENGDTVTDTFLGEQVEREPTEQETHKAIKAVCARVGKDGCVMDVRDMRKIEMSRFIDHVLAAAAQYGMDMDALEARRPE